MRNNERRLPLTQLVYDVISTVGAATTTQIHEISKGYYGNINAAKQENAAPEDHVSLKYYDEERTNAMIRALCMDRKIKSFDDKYHIPFYTKDIDTRKLPALWVMLDLISNEYGCDPEMLKQIVEGNGIVDFSYIQDHSIVVNLIYIGQSDRSKIVAANQRFYDYTGCEKGKENEQGIVYVFATESLEAADMVVESKLRFPHKVALVEGDISQHPTIRYLE